MQDYTRILCPQYKQQHQRLQDEYLGRHHPHAPGLSVYAWYLNERESIRILREELGCPAPWTSDPILGGFRFTNIRREDDRVSRDLVAAMDMDAPPATILFNAFIFRTFNWKDGFEAAGGFHHLWHRGKAEEGLDFAYDLGTKLFSSSYLMTNSMTEGAPKYKFYLKIFDQVWEQRTFFLDHMRKHPTLEATTKMFTVLDGYAEFLGYELALDMQMLGLLEPTDAHTWTNPGPGARRGLNWIFGRPKEFQQPVPKFLDEIRWLYDEMPYFLWAHIDPEERNMRWAENGLCETGKYFSVLTTGRAKRKYP